MMYVFQIHWMLRKGLSAEFVSKTSAIGLDDLPEDVTYEEAKEMAVSEFKLERYRAGTSENSYFITDICTA